MTSFIPPRAQQPPYPPFLPQPPVPAPPPIPPERPMPPQPSAPPGLPEVHLSPPVVFVEPTFEYRQLSRDLAGGAPVSEDELDELGRSGWELVSVITDGRTAHFYFKRLAR